MLFTLRLTLKKSESFDKNVLKMVFQLSCTKAKSLYKYSAVTFGLYGFLFYLLGL